MWFTLQGFTCLQIKRTSSSWYVFLSFFLNGAGSLYSVIKTHLLCSFYKFIEPRSWCKHAFWISDVFVLIPNLVLEKWYSISLQRCNTWTWLTELNLKLSGATSSELRGKQFNMPPIKSSTHLGIQNKGKLHKSFFKCFIQSFPKLLIDNTLANTTHLTVIRDRSRMSPVSAF